MAAKSSYEASSKEIFTLFSDYLEGDDSRPALALSERTMQPVARNALEKSLEAFGYGPDACTFATLRAGSASLPAGEDVPALESSPEEGSDIPLDADALFWLVEGLDPLHVIATDNASIAALSRAYRTPYQIDSPIRVFGRPSAAFANLDELLETPEGKQRAWKVLKSLKTR